VHLSIQSYQSTVGGYALPHTFARSHLVPGISTMSDHKAQKMYRMMMNMRAPGIERRSSQPNDFAISMKMNSCQNKRPCQRAIPQYCQGLAGPQGS
jgi:hypothetical protein